MTDVRELLADASEPPAVIPVDDVAVDVHAAPDNPTAERGTARLAVLVPPLRTVRVLVGEGGVVDVDLPLRVRVRLETTRLVLPIEFVDRDIATELEEDDVDFFGARAAGRHSDEHGVVYVLPTILDPIDELRGFVAVDGDMANDDVALLLDVLTHDLEKSGREVLVADDELSRLGAELRAMLVERRNEEVAELVDLSVGHGEGRGWGHG